MAVLYNFKIEFVDNVIKVPRGHRDRCTWTPAQRLVGLQNWPVKLKLYKCNRKDASDPS